MSDGRGFAGWSCWFRWVGGTMLGWFVGFIGGFILAHIIPLGNVTLGIGVGAAVGYMQWRVLRGFVQQSGRWILASTAGPTVSLSIYAFVHAVTEYPFDLGWPAGVLGWTLAFLVAGTITGVVQQGILRHHLGQSIWWVPASTIGWALSIVVGAGVMAIERGPLGVFAAPPVGGIVLGAVTWGALFWLFRQPTADEVS